MPNKKMESNAKKSNPREIAVLVLNRVERDGAFSNIALFQELQKKELAPLDKGLATEIVYGTLRQQGTLDYILNQFLKQPLEKLPVWILLILRTGLYQLFYMDKIPVSAAINEAVELAKKYGHKGTAGLVNGTLRNIARSREQITFPNHVEDPAAYISVCYSHPRWLVERWLQEFGEEDTIALCQYDNNPSPFSLRVNTLKTTRDDVLAGLADRGLTAFPGRYATEAVILEGVKRAEDLDLIEKGLVYPQHQSSMLAAYALDPAPGSRVLDACAAPGGKTTHLAQLMKNQGEIKAFDLYQHKIQLIEENCRRLGVTIVDAQVGDSKALPIELNDWADYALVDAPCSGLGVLQSRPDARWQKSEETIQNMAAVAYDILQCAATKVKVGGVLLFSTCTITPEENENTVARFLAEYPNYVAEAITNMPEMLYEKQASWQILPQKHGIDGFFFTRMRRIG